MKEKIVIIIIDIESSLAHTLNTASDDGYQYTQDLLKLGTGRSKRQTVCDPRLATISTPLNLAAWRNKLTKHPDKEYARYILEGIEYGFAIGGDDTRTFKSAQQNMLSAKQHPQVIERYLDEEVHKGNILGPFSEQMATKIHINRFGVIPKKHQPGKWRLITDLSYPDEASVNDSICPESCSLTYTTVNEVAEAAVALGKGALIAKIDIKSAYRLVPVCPQDRRYLGMRWNGAVYVDGMLPFGLRSAPKIFNALADALEWCVSQEGVSPIYHYLDDFAVIGPPDSTRCLDALHTLSRVCSELGVPLAQEKQDGPTTKIVFLGILIDTVRQELRLPEDKLKRILETVTHWIGKKACTKNELESLIGSLHHACQVIHPGRSFMRRAISLLKVAKCRHHHIRLNAEFRSDMMWWKVFASHWNGASLLIHKDSTEVTLTSDASGTWGCGAYSSHKWFQLRWNDKVRGWHIAAKELIPIVIAGIVWGKEWKGCRVLAQCDNAAVVAVVNKRYCQDKHLMRMLRCLFFVEAHFQFKTVATHIPGVDNDLADDLSRDKLSSFMGKYKESNPNPTFIPPLLLQWLLQQELDWTSPNWTEQFSSIVRRV